MAVFAVTAPDALSHKTAILVVFAITYVGITMGHFPWLKLNRTGIALLGAICMMTFGGLSTSDVISLVNWPTIFLLFGFFVISAQLRLSGFYDLIAGAISTRLDHPARFLLLLMVVTGALSAVLNHDIVVYVFAPIVAAALMRKRLNPVPYLIALAISSNIGAGATLIGNAQDMMIGEVAGLNFERYLAWAVVPVVFAMGCSFGIIWMLSRKTIAIPVADTGATAGHAYPLDRSHTVKGVVIFVAVLALFFTQLPKELIVLAAAGIHLASPKFGTDDLIGLVEWPILIFFMSLFVVAGAFQATGCGDQAMQWLARNGFDLNAPHNLVPATAVLSNLINNSPAVMLLIKVIDHSKPVTGYLLAMANSFGGSLIIIGSVGNIIVVQQARQMGINIRFRDFARLGVPTTLAALAGLLAWAAVAG